jgi:hypothetical protein
MGKAEDDALRAIIAKKLSSGLATTTEPVPGNSDDFAEILKELRELAPGELEEKLVISGFVDHPYGEEGRRCLECIYYRMHRKWCALPPIALPVEPEWWCRLWRI